MTLQTASFGDLLRSRVEVERPTNVTPARFDPATARAQLIEELGQKIRRMRNEGRVVVGYDPDCPEPFFDACAEPTIVAYEVEEFFRDSPKEAALAKAIFKAGGFHEFGLRPASVRALVEIQILVIETIRQGKFLFAEQQPLR